MGEKSSESSTSSSKDAATSTATVNNKNYIGDVLYLIDNLQPKTAPKIRGMFLEVYKLLNLSIFYKLLKWFKFQNNSISSSSWARGNAVTTAVDGTFCLSPLSSCCLSIIGHEKEKLNENKLQNLQDGLL